MSERNIKYLDIGHSMLSIGYSDILKINLTIEFRGN